MWAPVKGAGGMYPLRRCRGCCWQDLSSADIDVVGFVDEIGAVLAMFGEAPEQCGESVANTFDPLVAVLLARHAQKDALDAGDLSLDVAVFPSEVGDQRYDTGLSDRDFVEKCSWRFGVGNMTAPDAGSSFNCCANLRCPVFALACGCV